MEQGIVKWFDIGKGVGIVRSQNGEEVTIHLAALTASGLKGPSSQLNIPDLQINLPKPASPMLNFTPGPILLKPPQAP